jgi:hypothetical protein
LAGLAELEEQNIQKHSEVSFWAMVGWRCALGSARRGKAVVYSIAISRIDSNQTAFLSNCHSRVIHAGFFPTTQPCDTVCSSDCFPKLASDLFCYITTHIMKLSPPVELFEMCLLGSECHGFC